VLWEDEISLPHLSLIQLKELRSDRRGEAIDIYHHKDRQELRKAYLAYIPKLGI
jgi:hypothetical protein